MTHFLLVAHHIVGHWYLHPSAREGGIRLRLGEGGGIRLRLGEGGIRLRLGEGGIRLRLGEGGGLG